MKRIVITLLLAVFTLGTSLMALAGRQHEQAYYDYAEVIKVKPITEVVRVESPYRECWTETRARYGHYNGHKTYTPEIFGAIVGAAVGNRFGSGRGRDLATAAGAVLGGSIGHDIKHRRQGRAYQEPVERCEIRHEYHDEEQVVGYRVKYSYNGKIYHTRMRQHPSDRIRVRVHVEPVE